ncbi:MAG TPA: phosphoribosylformylglycinamidine synthase subunit PurL [Vicinamibacterales bacterium]|nr:phosphoribosylformylglycinamidine synthase subunit PurL [Vicinamibacterales bacterium]
MTPDPALLERHRLTGPEYERIVQALGREPTETELGIFSVMWSEHCSYKSSRIHLRKLPTAGPRVLQGPGENAGAVDIGEGLAAVFKIESHNHPSFIEPYQGAATGVGGIIRDIFTMGARPIALMNSLRFGPLDGPDAARTRRIMEGVVAGIAGYGNSIGIPTVAGEIAFEAPYAGNPLVNVFCLGIASADALVKGTAAGAGNPVYYVGSKTGRDGIHGATMASAEFDENSAEKRPAVQVGDPFMEKLLLEACLELMRTDALVGVQDMGAAGLTCSTCEMGSRGGSGIEIDVTHVPQREAGMTPYEIMLSESQERMLLVVKKGREREVEEIFEKWDLHAARIGEVTGDKLLRIKDHGTVIAEVPATALADDAPMYRRPFEETRSQKDLRTMPALGPSPAPRDAFVTLLASPGIASKQWIYRQYDSMVRTNTLVPAGGGAGVVRVKGTNTALAMSVDGNGRYCLLDPYEGARLAVAEAARNVACAGGAPIGVTNCLNFGNPERPEIMWQFAEAVRGIGDACRALELPVTGGNVSLYNETDGQAILPTPVIGVLGLIDKADTTLSRVFPEEALDVVLLGSTRAEFGGSEYLKTMHGIVRGVPPALDIELERSLQSLLVEGASKRWIRSAHDCADGGFAVTLAECCFSGRHGADVNVPGAAGSSFDAATAALFAESASRAVVSVARGQTEALLARAAAVGVPAAVIGRTGGGRLVIRVDGDAVIDCAVAEAEQHWTNGLAKYFESKVA